MQLNLTGATRLYIIVGDPIAQVKSPGGMTKAFADHDRDAIVVPVQVDPRDLGDLLHVADRLKNLDGIIVTMPHKFACRQYCTSVSGRSEFINAVSIMRRKPGGGWHGDVFDGTGFVLAMLGKGYNPSGQRGLLVGAGGTGSAIAFALMEAGVRELAIHDEDAVRRDTLVLRLTAQGKGRVVAGSPDPTGFDFVGNATPAGMKPGDPLPLDISKLAPATYVGCVITVPAVPPLLEAARKLGCVHANGTEMYNALQHKMVEFLLHPEKQG